MIKITTRDGFFLFAGMLLGVSLMFLWLNITVTNVINSILPNINIEAINFKINETALVEALNKTISANAK